MAESGATQYFQSVFFAYCLSAGLGVLLHTLMLITATKRMYLVNGYSVVKELRETVKKPPHFSKGKSEGVERNKFLFFQNFLSLANILRFRSLIVFCGMPEMLDHSLSDNS